MPGLSQLKQFEKDILSLGDELTLRSSRGEKPVKVPIPKSISVDNDSEDFVLGMPENPLEKTATVVDDDLSDLTGSKTKSSSSSDVVVEQSNAPDLSSLLAPVVDISDNSGDSDAGMPDLSMFMDAPEPEVQEEIPVEEKEISIADMGLDALLAGAGFDGSEGTGNEEIAQSDSDSSEYVSDFDSVILEEKSPKVDKNEDDIFNSSLNKQNQPKSEPQSDFEMPDELKAIFGTKTPAAEKEQNENADLSFLNDELPAEDLFKSENPTQDFASDFDTPSFDNSSFDTPSFDNSETISDFETTSLETPASEDTDFGTEKIDVFSSEDFEVPDDFEASVDFDTPVPIDLPPEVLASQENKNDSALEGDSLDLSSLGFEVEDITSSSNSSDNKKNDSEKASFNFGSDSSTDFDLDSLEPLESLEPLDDFDDFGSFGEETPSADDDNGMSETKTETVTEDVSDDFFTEDVTSAIFNADDVEIPTENDMSGISIEDNLTDTGETPIDFFADDSPSLDSDASFENDNKSNEFDFENVSFDDISSMDDKSDSDFGMEIGNDIFDSTDNDIPDYEDDSFDTSGLDESGLDESGFDEENGPLEIFDTTEMNDVDFGIPDTDSSMEGDFGPAEDMSFDGSDFEIPGFSDVSTVQEPKKNAKVVQKNKKLDAPDFSKGIAGEELPPNTLSDEQYAKFLKNFNEYPLNVRLAFEDLIVQDEFTDDAEFEIIEKVLNKAPARQIAAMLEKMLDTSIPVPRDYEHRTAEEYEAYKKSIQYQLRNKILPGALIFILLIFTSWGLFNFTKNCIYIPAKASKYYKQGYTLLQSDEYSQAQMKFDLAAALKMKKKWFFKYAREYKAHKQYQRAADIYMKTLYYFDHDKQAGLEYAEMELNSLSNYSKAEEIVRRQVLDYHVNDADGILLLGDIFLEWGTEKEPEKLELAKEEYLKLMQLYEVNNLYNSRMMRYYIRSDNIQQVLIYQHMFEQDEKSLGADDWTELSGYLLEKMYGPLSPSDEHYRYQIEGLRAMLLRAVSMNPENPVALYNLSNYYINTNEIRNVEVTLNSTIEKFNNAEQLTNRDIYKFIDSYRLLGENYLKTNDYLQAQEQYTKGITLYTTEKENAGFEGNQKIGILYADLADINYLLAGDYDNAAINYKNSVELGNDNPSIRYRLGYISYKNKNYQEALGSFMKASEGNVKQKNLLFSMANTLALRNDDYAAEGYYEQLISALDMEIENAGGSIYPQTNADQYDLVDLYLYAANNYGVVLHRLAKRTGDSQKNAESIVQLQQSVRAWDALTRNQKTMMRLEGSNLAEENIKYVTHPVPGFEPSIYIEIPKTLTDLERL